MLGNLAVDESIDLNWIRSSLNIKESASLRDSINFAIFESPTRFLVRLGNLGENPVHFYLTLTDWDWRLTGIYK
jgi:hypothetical protein